MEEALGPFHVPQQSRRNKLRIAPPLDDDQHYPSLYVTGNTLDLPRYHHLSAAAPSAQPSSSPPPQFLPPPPRFNSLPSPLSINDTFSQIVNNTGPEVITSSSAPDQARDSDHPGFRNADAGKLALVIGGDGGLNLSLATHARGGQTTAGRCRSAAAMTMAAAPVGPFTGYASILSRSRFLKPAEELLEGFCGAIRRDNDKEKVMEDSTQQVEEEGDWSACIDASQSHHRGGGNSSLLSLLHEVYKRYRVYCQQMHSAVTSFQSVAGLGNAAPFISFAIKAVSKHFHCLKNAILDHINFANNELLLGKEEFRKTSDGINTLSEHRAFGTEQKQQLHKSSLNHHPVWRSQRGFPDKAVAVLKAWLFENFLHPYPTDSDKEMLARKTGLSRSQVSNWFTNARVRLWKPMVEEIHSLEKQSGFSTESEHRKMADISNNHFMSVNTQDSVPDNHTKPSKIQRVKFYSQADGMGKEEEQQMGLLAPSNNSMLSNNNTQFVGAGGSCELGRNNTSSSTQAPQGVNEATTIGISWSNAYGQSVPFWLAK